MRALSGVADAIGGVDGDATLIDKSGKPIVFGGAPNLGFSVDPAHPRFNSLSLVRGRWPGADEVVIDYGTARKKRIGVGQQLGVLVGGRVERLRVSGVVRYVAVSSIGGATLAGFSLETAQRLFRRIGKLDQIRAAAREGVTCAELMRQIRRILPPNTEARSGACS